MAKLMNDRQVIYLDTNILVSMLTEDALSARAIEWFESRVEPLAISAWICTEFNAIAGVRKRKGELRAAVAKVAIKTFHQRAQKNFLMLNVSNEAATLAASWLRILTAICKPVTPSISPLPTPPVRPCWPHVMSASPKPRRNFNNESENCIDWRKSTAGGASGCSV